MSASRTMNPGVGVHTTTARIVHTLINLDRLSHDEPHRWCVAYTRDENVCTEVLLLAQVTPATLPCSPEAQSRSGMTVWSGRRSLAGGPLLRNEATIGYVL